MGPKKIWVQKKLLVQKKILSKKKLSSKKVLGLKNISGQKKMFGPKKFLSPKQILDPEKNFGLRKILVWNKYWVQNKVWVQIDFRSKNGSRANFFCKNVCGSTEIWGQKLFGSFYQWSSSIVSKYLVILCLISIKLGCPKEQDSHCCKLPRVGGWL